MNIGIVGLGLIGGSLAKAIQQKTEHRVLGYDISEGVLQKAEQQEAINSRLTDELLETCDKVIIALYPADTISYMKEHARLFSKTAIVIDCCGVKEIVAKQAEPIAKQYGFTYIGGHPMAGLEHSGFDYSKHALFENASMVLTPPPSVSPEALELAKEFFLSVGFSRIQIASPAEHDRMIAYTSQLAHVVSSAYVMSDTALQHKGFSAGSYKDLTRVARLNDQMWTELFLDNAEYLSQEIDGLIHRLTQMKDFICSGDRDRLRALLKSGSDRKILLDGEEKKP